MFTPSQRPTKANKSTAAAAVLKPKTYKASASNASSTHVFYQADGSYAESDSGDVGPNDTFASTTLAPHLTSSDEEIVVEQPEGNPLMRQGAINFIYVEMYTFEHNRTDCCCGRNPYPC